MKITFLGTGTSVGIPVIGCDCRVCLSDNPRNRRRRSSLLVEAGGTHIVVDTPPDFREQALEYCISRVDAVLFTHSHADHIFGFDDIRRFNTIQESAIPAYGAAETIGDLKRIFHYIGGKPKSPGLFRPQIDYKIVDGPFMVEDVQISPFHVEHGAGATLGYLFEHNGKRVGYAPDCRRIEDDVLAMLRGVDVMILDALRYRAHNTHLTFDESVELLGHIGARESYTIHMCHDIDHDEVEATMPEMMHISYDGLTLSL